MPGLDSSWTLERLHALPGDGNRYEIVEGALFVSPAPSYLHQNTILELVKVLEPFCVSVGLHLLFAPAAVTWSHRTEGQPDILVLPLIDGRRATRFEEVGRVELCVEVLSPSSLAADRFIKRREYQRRGVPEFWVVDPASRSVEVWRPVDEDPRIVFDRVVWQPRAGSEQLKIDLAELFRAALDA